MNGTGSARSPTEQRSNTVERTKLVHYPSSWRNGEKGARGRTPGGIGSEAVLWTTPMAECPASLYAVKTEPAPGSEEDPLFPSFTS